MSPSHLNVLAWLVLALGGAAALLIAFDVTRRPQHMGVMNVVWPTTALFGGPFVMWLYYRYGALSTHEAMHEAHAKGGKSPAKTQTPFPIMVAKGCLHCGSGCMLGDIGAEWLAFAAPVVALWFGWGSIFSDKTFAVWILDFVFAFLLGIVFQYFAIVPMRKLSPGAGIVAALKADALSLIAWQVGMYGFMAFAQFYLLPRTLGHRVEVNTPEFWFMMQLAMIAGFFTAYPVNWWLIRSGVKERM